MWGDVGRLLEMGGDVGKCVEMLGRCGEMWGDVSLQAVGRQDGEPAVRGDLVREKNRRIRWAGSSQDGEL